MRGITRSGKGENAEEEERRAVAGMRGQPWAFQSTKKVFISNAFYFKFPLKQQLRSISSIPRVHARPSSPRPAFIPSSFDAGVPDPLGRYKIYS